ncbi:MAG: hypothetical protein KJO69_01170 [Gammaproteobacteria bacterium]|nr:hypothetical protein [Gammaproteobacteria bacterium]
MSEFDDYSNYHLGCTDCGSVFTVEDLYGGGCPVCESSNILSFEDALESIIAHREFMEQLGLEEYE